jgi:hypothetical protein
MSATVIEEIAKIVGRAGIRWVYGKRRPENNQFFWSAGKTVVR